MPSAPSSSRVRELSQGATTRIGMFGERARSVRPTLPKRPATSRGPSERFASTASVAKTLCPLMTIVPSGRPRPAVVASLLVASTDQAEGIRSRSHATAASTSSFSRMGAFAGIANVSITAFVLYMPQFAVLANYLPKETSLETVHPGWYGARAVRDVAGTAEGRRPGARAERFRETAERLPTRERYGKSGCQGIEKPRLCGAFP